MKNILYILLLLAFTNVFSQEKDKQKSTNESKQYTYEANQKTATDFVAAEADYRKAISKNPENTVAKYNLGNAYYKKENLDEASFRYEQAVETAQTKAQKHKAYHNMGNINMKNKAYQKAIEAYKNALRNNPSDDETRYNLALAKEKLKKEQQNQKNDKDQKDKNDQKKDDKNKEDNKNKKDKDQKDQKDKKGDEKDKKDNEGGKDGKEKQKKNNKGDDDKQNENDPNKKGNSKPRPNQLSPQQVKNLLEAMQNEEKKVQEKINAQKIKGVKTKTEKDW